MGNSQYTVMQYCSNFVTCVKGTLWVGVPYTDYIFKLQVTTVLNYLCHNDLDQLLIFTSTKHSPPSSR